MAPRLSAVHRAAHPGGADERPCILVALHWSPGGRSPSQPAGRRDLPLPGRRRASGGETPPPVRVRAARLRRRAGGWPRQHGVGADPRYPAQVHSPAGAPGHRQQRGRDALRELLEGRSSLVKRGPNTGMPSPKPEIRIVENAKRLAWEAAEEFVQQAGEAVQGRRVFTVALAGGSTPRALYRLLAGDGEPSLPRHVPW